MTTHRGAYTVDAEGVIHKAKSLPEERGVHLIWSTFVGLTIAQALGIYKGTQDYEIIDNDLWLTLHDSLATTN